MENLLISINIIVAALAFKLTSKAMFSDYFRCKEDFLDRLSKKVSTMRVDNGKE